MIALLYFLRWKTEKSFDVTKNRLHQQKAWANGENASLVQAHFSALAHNLLTVLLSTLEKAGLHEAKAEQKCARLHIKSESQRVPVQELVRYATQITCQFIRLIRHCLSHKTSWKDAFPLFTARLQSYL